jgi:predicted P-loop ATPase
VNLKLRSALLYSSWNWPIFRLTAYKTPLKGSHGHLDATCDVTTLRQWYDTARPPNLGLACGRVVALDLDGKAWAQSRWGASLKAAADANDGFPPTLMQQTARGLHLLYQVPAGVTVRTRNEPRKKDSPGVDIKGEGGYIVLAPSINFKNKFTYRWINTLKPALLPQWLIDWCQTVGRDDKIAPDTVLNLGERPVYLANKSKSNQYNIAERSSYLEKPVWSFEEECRIRAALASIPNDCGHDAFVRIGLALQGLDWIRSDGTSISFDLFDSWCARAKEYYNPDGLEKKWENFQRTSRGEVTIGSLYRLARQHGWNGQAAVETEKPPAMGATPGASNEERVAGKGESVTQFPSTTFPAKVNGHHLNGAGTLPAELISPIAIRFHDTNEDGFPKATMSNAAQAIAGLQVTCAKDMFHERCEVGGRPIERWAGELSDDVIVMLRRTVRLIYGFDPGDAHTRHGAIQLCLENQFDPLLQFLDGLRWDGIERIDTWMQVYLKAPDTALNRAISRLSLVAACRRARHPGTKFDQIVVLESPEGLGKSTALEVLAGGRDFYSSQQVLGLDDKAQQEASVGVWLHEIADLQGMRKSEVERVKAFASRTEDRARPAYGRFRVDKPRRCIYFATTNEEDYLKSDTGNRRFWPVRVGEIDLAALARDREQLWAEAAAAEAAGESIVLNRKLWDVARIEQDDRMEREPWTELIQNYVALAGKERDDVTVKEVLVDNQFIQLRPEALDQRSMSRAARALRALGFTKYRRRIGKSMEWRYRKHVDGTTQTL